MTYLEKFWAARNRIDSWLDSYRDPCVLWSGGKDSTVLLHLVRSMGKDLPVVTFQEPWQRGRLAYTQRIATEWNLTLYDFPPSQMGLNRGNGRIDIMQCFQLGAGQLWLARGTEPVEDPRPGNYVCAVDWLKRPVGGMQFPWDAAFHGQKSSDEDPCSGTVPLACDIKRTPGSPDALYPLREWTDEDVFLYAEEHGIELDPRRYGKVGTRWVVLEDKSGTPDYYNACTRCIDPDQAAVVHCPKLNAEVNNIADQAYWPRLSMPLCGYETNVSPAN